MNKLGWGKITETGAELWDSNPVFLNHKVRLVDFLKLFFYPKKFFLYRSIIKFKKHEKIAGDRAFRILDVGCGTGSSLIDLSRMLGRGVEVYGADVLKNQVDIAKEKIDNAGVSASVLLYNGARLPFPDGYFDAIYTSDVLGHVKDVRQWLLELQRVLKRGGLLAMFSESSIGKHAVIRKYLFKRGLNVDPQSAFHISLYSKKDLKNIIEESGFAVNKMASIFLLAFFLLPDQFYQILQTQSKFPILRVINVILYRIKKFFHPISTALCELYGLCEMLAVGRLVESQGYVILAKKQ